MMNSRLHFPFHLSLDCIFRRAAAMLLTAFALGTTAQAQPAVTNVRATQRAGTKIVDIIYDLAHATGLASTVHVDVSQDGGTIYGTAGSLTGAVGAGITPGTGKTVVWNAGQDWTAVLFSNVRVRVTADDGQITGGGTTPAGMALIPTGAFVMGDASNEGYPNEAPTRTVTVSAIYLSKTEVSFAEWKEVRDWAVSRGYTDLASVGTGKADTHPVQEVSWYDAVQWLNAKSEKEGLTPVYYTNDSQTTVYRTGSVNVTAAQVQWTANGYRLPTEAEWEKAARGGTAGKRFPSGDAITHLSANYFSDASYSYDTSLTRGFHPTYGTGAQPYTSPVGILAANGYGLFDMAGNAVEWCWDFYGTDTGTSDPRGPSSGGERDIRGGAWYNDAFNCRAAFRGHIIPSRRGVGLGFRPARSASGTNTVIASSSAFAIDLSVAPTISTQPSSQTVIAGGNASFTVVASGTAPLAYQWRKDNTTISGETNATLTLTNVQSANSGNYSVVVSNSVNSVTSGTATLTVASANQPPSFTSSSPTGTGTVGAAYSFTYRANGNPAPTFAVASGTLPPGLTLAASGALSGTPTQAGTYAGTVKAANGIGSDATQDFNITVAAQPVPPTITSQPAANQTVNVGGSVTFFISATGTPSPTYQWRKDGAVLTGEVGAALTLFNIQGANAGTYTVVASNIGGSAPSGPIILTVNVPPAITTQPANVTVNAGQTATLTVSATGSAPLSYQWRKYGSNLSTATNASLTITSTQPSDGGSYDVIVSNAGGSANSSTATLTVNGPPVISTQPASQTVTSGNSVTLTLTATSTLAATYQWQKGGVNIPGATNASLSIAAVRVEDAGQYTCVVTNSAGSVTSSAATLTVNPSNPSRLTNVSILTSIDSPGDSFTIGYVVGGSGTTGAKPLVVRAAGPSLGALGVPGTIDDPKIEFFAGATKTGENDNWGGSSALANAMAGVGAFAFTGSTSNDAAAAFSVTTSDNSVKVAAVGTGTGAVIAEIYEATPSASFTSTDPRLVNLSVIKSLGTGFTIGFVVGGNGGKTVLIRAIGPTLVAFGVQGAATDPQVKLFSGQTQIGANDNWGGTAALTAAFSAVGAFTLPAASKDAALLATLQPGNYTAQVSGVDGTTGVAIVEVYEVP